MAPAAMACAGPGPVLSPAPAGLVPSTALGGAPEPCSAPRPGGQDGATAAPDGGAVGVPVGSQGRRGGGWGSQTGLWGGGPPSWARGTRTCRCPRVPVPQLCARRAASRNRSSGAAQGTRRVRGRQSVREPCGPAHGGALQPPVARWGQGNAWLLGPDRKETSPPRSVTQTRWGRAGFQARRVVTDRNRSKAAGRKRLGGTPAAGAGIQPGQP